MDPRDHAPEGVATGEEILVRASKNLVAETGGKERNKRRKKRKPYAKEDNPVGVCVLTKVVPGAQTVPHHENSKRLLQ